MPDLTARAMDMHWPWWVCSTQHCSVPTLQLTWTVHGGDHTQTGKAPTVSTVEDLRPKTWTSCLFHTDVGPVALVPLLLLGAMLLHGVLRRKLTRRRGTQRLSNSGVYNNP